MIHPTEIKSKAERIYLKYLQHIAAGMPFERLVIPCDKKPSKDFDTYRKEYECLYAASKEVRGYGIFRKVGNGEASDIGQAGFA